MSLATDLPLHQQSMSLQHDALVDVLAKTENLLIIQDLDGVCMGLVNDPLHRLIETDYVTATRSLGDHFYVLTNGEHIGQRGVNGIVERAFGDPGRVKSEGLYLPGLAAGGVQWQERDGQVSHPGVSDAELTFLKAVPNRIREQLHEFFAQYPDVLDEATLATCIDSSALDNVASPTANLNTLYGAMGGQTQVFAALQKTMQALMDQLLAEASAQELAESFFVHYAPNLGRGADGKEVIWWSDDQASGTTDFQFMLRGAIKEAGVLALLNRYVYQRTGAYPLGEGFNARQAPHDHDALLQLVKDNFDPAVMPKIIGVGDTVTSQIIEEKGNWVAKRGGSDRNFLTLVQDIGRALKTDNLVVYVDSSDGELKNRKATKLTTLDGQTQVIEGPCDPRDTQDPLTLNVVVPGGYQQYSQLFQTAARQRNAAIANPIF
ncbi:MAG: glucosylglycerol 3-phosphatase [Cyanobacteria bacterium J06639_16]